METYSLNGIKFGCRENTIDRGVAIALIQNDEYHIRELARPGEIFVDLGGYGGHASLLAASLGMQCVVVEPIPDNVKFIHENIKLNSFESKIKVLPFAIGGKTGEHISLSWYWVDNDFLFKHRFVANPTPPSMGAIAIEVETISLDDALSPYKNIWLLKTDCEGAEWPAFRNVSPPTLSKIKYIAGEIHPTEGTYEDFLKLLPGFKDVSSSFGQIESKSLRAFTLESIKYSQTN